MPPPPRIRPIVEQMIHDGATPNQIAARAEELGVCAEYLLQVYRGLTSIASSIGSFMPDRDAHRKHLQALYDANGCGFSWWPPSLMERVYLLERSPAIGNPFWRRA